VTARHLLFPRPGPIGGPTAENYLARLGDVILDPGEFSSALLHHDLYPVQDEIMQSVASRARTAVKACHASGKTFVAADAVLWWPTRFEDGIVVTTAPTWTQVEKLLWGNVHMAAAGSSVGYPKLHKTEIELDKDNYAIGLSTNEGVRFQGWHGRILVILDEAPGVIPEIWEAIEGIRAGGQVHVLALGQPSVLGGPFHMAFHRPLSGWNTITISAFDTPNLLGTCIRPGTVDDTGRPIVFGDPDGLNLLEATEEELDVAPRPYLTLRRWVLEKWFEWGEPGSPLWDIKVMGDFPEQSEDALLSLKWIEAAKTIILGHTDAPIRAGIDVAGPGSAETVVSLRQGPNRLSIRAFTHADARGPVIRHLRDEEARLSAAYGRKVEIQQVNVDAIGQGHYFGLGVQDADFKVRFVNVQHTFGIDPKKFRYQKDAYYWHLRELFRKREIGGVNAAREIEQLLTIRYFENHKGQVEIVPKEDMVKDGIPSPDWAEADMLAYAPDAPGDIPPRHGVVTQTGLVSGAPG
jgi:phage terminase large subunit